MEKYSFGRITSTGGVLQDLLTYFFYPSLNTPSYFQKGFFFLFCEKRGLLYSFFACCNLFFFFFSWLAISKTFGQVSTPPVSFRYDIFSFLLFFSILFFWEQRGVSQRLLVTQIFIFPFFFFSGDRMKGGGIHSTLPPPPPPPPPQKAEWKKEKRKKKEKKYLPWRKKKRMKWRQFCFREQYTKRKSNNAKTGGGGGGGGQRWVKTQISNQQGCSLRRLPNSVPPVVFPPPFFFPLDRGF